MVDISDVNLQTSLNHNQIGKIPGSARGLAMFESSGNRRAPGLEFASFPLTPSLSPRRGRALARRWKIRTWRLQSPLLGLSFRRQTTTNFGRITEARVPDRLLSLLLLILILLLISIGSKQDQEQEQEQERFGPALVCRGPPRSHPTGPVFGSGKQTLTRVPRPAWDFTLKLPCRRRTRSSILARPRPLSRRARSRSKPEPESVTTR